MLYLLHGTDVVAVRRKLHAVIDPLLAERPETPVVTFEQETFIAEELSNHIAERGLFAAARVVVFDGVFGEEENDARIWPLLSDMTASHNTLIFLAGAIEKEVAEKFKSGGAQVHQFTAASVRPTFNVFTLTDALGRRDKKKLWVEFRKAAESEGGDEGFFFYATSMLFWQVKSMLLAASSATAAEAGMKPFPFQKAKQSLKNYSLEEVKNLSSKLIALTHDSRRGIHDLETALERFVLSI